MIALCFAFAGALPPLAAAAADPVAKCQSSVGRAGRKLAKAHLGAWRSCLAAQAAGKACDAAARDAALAAGGTKFVAEVVAGCEGAPAFTAPPAGLGFPSNCDLEPGAIDTRGCATLPVSDATSLGACLLCWERSSMDTLVRAAHPCPSSTAPVAGGLSCGTAPSSCAAPKVQVKCGTSIAKSVLRLAQARQKAVQGCLDRRRLGKTTSPCPDAVAAEKIAKAEAKSLAAITKCEAAPPWWSQCPVDPDGACGPAIDGLAGIAACAGQATEVLVDGSVCRLYPGSGSEGLTCPAPAPTTTTTTSTTTSTTTTTLAPTTTTTTTTTSTTLPPPTTSTTTSTTLPPTTTTTSTTLPPPVCGDSAIDPGEDCDPPGSACGAGGTCSAGCACTGGDPFVGAITPAGGNLGTVVEITGAGFGSDAGVVRVRFRFEQEGEVFEPEVPVLEATDSSLRVALPLLPPARSSSVVVVVDATPSNAVPYEAGGYPWDPTPEEPGSEIVSFLGLLDQLATRFDGKLDPWFVDTGALDATEAAELHAAAEAMREGIAAFLASLGGMDADLLRAVDGLMASPLLLELRDLLQQAVDALHGSPTGEILCEAQKVVEILGDVLALLDVITTIIDIIVVTVSAACAASILLAIFTLGIGGPFAAIVCGGGLAAVVEVLRTINDILKVCAAAITAITNAAPTAPIPDTWELSVQHEAWFGGEPAFVYVDGEPAVEARSTQDFHNERCAIPGGCDLSFTVHVFEIPVPVSISVPHLVVEDQAMDTDLSFPPGPDGPGFVAIPSGVDGLSLFTARDVNGPDRERGVHQVTFSSDCTDRTGLLGSATRSYEVIAAPRVTSIGATHGQLGDQVEICAEDVPPDSSRILVDFGDTFAHVTESGNPGCYLLQVPDSAGGPPITLTASGTRADTSQPFDIDPPVLLSVEPSEAFPGETVRLLGSGFASDPANNALTLDGVEVNVTEASPGELRFEVPDAPSGELRLVAVGVHESGPLPLTILHWGEAARLSHPSRDATRPELAVNVDGSVGVVWADRAASGGRWRLVFATARPGQAAFEAPFELTSDLGQFGDAPERAAIAALGDGDFFVVWIAGDGSIRRMRIEADGSSSEETEVVPAPTGAAWHDLDVAALGDLGVVSIVVEEQPFSGDWFTSLYALTSDDDGVTFDAPEAFAGPGTFAGELDLASRGDTMARTFRFASDYFGPTIFTQTSIDGRTWTLPAEANESGEDGNLLLRPSVAISDAGAVVAWERAFTSYGEEIHTASAPFSGEGVSFYSGWAHAGAPTMVGDANGTLTMAWLSRESGASPDLVDGVPRILASRSTDGFASTTLVTHMRPTAPEDDLVSVDDAPALAVGPDRRLHLAWLRGTPGSRVVLHATNLDVPWGDAPVADDPAPSPAASAEWIATRLLYGPGGFVGHFAKNLDDPTRTRWLPTGGQANFRETTSSLHPDVPALLYMKEAEVALWDLGDEERAIVSPSGDFLRGPTVDVEWTPDARILGTQVHLWLRSDGSVSDVYDKVVVSGSPWPVLDGFGEVNLFEVDARFGEMQATMNQAGTHVALTHVREVAPGRYAYSLDVVDLAGGTDESPVVYHHDDGCQASWSPVTDTLVFVERIETAPTDDDFFEGVVLHEWNLGDAASTPLLTPAPGVDIAFPRYSPDGVDIAWQRRDDLADPWYVETLSGQVAPVAPMTSDTTPIWSPDGTTLMFVRTSLPDGVSTFEPGSELASWQPGSPTVTLLTDFPDGSLLAGGEWPTCSAEGQVNECFEGRPYWVDVQP